MTNGFTINYIHRQIEAKLLQAADQFPAVLVTGARQTGKSTLLSLSSTLGHYKFIINNKNNLKSSLH